MEKGFRIVQCPGCPVKLRISVSEKDYETTKKIRCPKCGTIGRVKIPRPAFQISHTKGPRSAGGASPHSEDFLDFFKELFNKKPKTQ